jgi:hypothetical protein
MQRTLNSGNSAVQLGDRGEFQLAPGAGGQILGLPPLPSEKYKIWFFEKSVTGRGPFSLVEPQTGLEKNV